MAKPQTARRQWNEQAEDDYVTLSIYEMPGHVIRRLNQASVSIFREEAAKAGIDLTTVQYATLVAIKTLPGIDQATIAGAIALDQVTIAGVLSRLERVGFISRKKDVTDRRSKLLFLEPAGKKVLAKMESIERKVQEKLLSALGPAEQELFMAMANKVADAVNELSRAPLRRVRRGAQRE